MPYTQAIAEAYASAPLDEQALNTIELRHPNFVDETGAPTSLRLVQGYDDYVLGVEGGAMVLFKAVSFGFSLPGFDEGSVPQMQLTIDNVSHLITTYLELALESWEPIELIYRPYLASDPSQPQLDPPIRMRLAKVKVDVFTATGTATLDDVNNWPFPDRRYTRNDFPGLFR